MENDDSKQKPFLTIELVESLAAKDTRDEYRRIFVAAVSVGHIQTKNYSSCMALWFDVVSLASWVKD